jgi:predicted nucleotidyltransferase
VNKASHILQLIKKSVATTAPGATVILYGSYARGDYHKDSDIDLLILVDKDRITRADRVKISYPLYDIGFDTHMVISPKVYAKHTWAKPKMVTPFYEEVNKDGVVL